MHEDEEDGTELVRKPDIAFVTTERVIPPKKGSCYHQAPDLAVEIISPSERIGRIRKKLREYFTYGTREVWLVYPDDQEIVVYTAADKSTTYKVGDTLPGSDLLPGLALEVGKVFAS